VARKRPAASDVTLTLAVPDATLRVDAGPDDPDALTLAQTRALRRCAPLNAEEFKAQRLVIAHQHRLSVKRILRRRGVSPRTTGV
jgi:hypothetical protein